MNPWKSCLITLTPKTFWSLIIIIIIFYLIISIGGGYFYGEYCKNSQQVKDMQEFAEMHQSVQFEIQGKSYCYSAEGRQTREAVYKGNNFYKVR